MVCEEKSGGVPGFFFWAGRLGYNGCARNKGRRMVFDVSPLIPEAQPVVLQAARIYWEHARPWFVGLLAHGSALKGDYIPGCSDVDMQLFLRGSLFDENGSIPLDMSLAIQRDLAKIDPAPFQYIQCYPIPDYPASPGRKHDIGPIPDTYHMVIGQLPVPEATPQQVRERAIRLLANPKTIAHKIPNDLLEHGGGRLERNVRWLCTDVWPTLYNVLTCRAENPLAVWKLPKSRAIALLPEEEPMGEAIRLFYKEVWAYYTGGTKLEQALEVISRGTTFIQLAEEWYRQVAAS